ncbi:hypothetical protein EU805_12620 [Salipiger sp. IMCC34102]|uniref:Hpt domain-containing protein n=1 Tax=Salipiger sp. IMCC34102 TaxID=2510647 RepID=UPI00101CF680|nr:Hpt domain-containing protein [Salipiger sp. IMCC34102]RYH02018.1 hypothetical protein EU805_12620 [Salipiger sp. IMCC34102]
MSDYNQKFRSIQRKFLNSIDVRVARMREALELFASGKTTDRSKLHLLIHDFTGNAAMLELHEIALEARKALNIFEGSEEAQNQEATGWIEEIGGSLDRVVILKEKHEALK